MFQRRSFLSASFFVCPRLAAIQVTITASDLVSAAPVTLVTEIDEDSVLTQKRTAVFRCCCFTGSDKVQKWMRRARSWLVLKQESLTVVAGKGMQVEDDLGDLDDTQVSEPGRKDGQKTVSRTTCSCAVRRMPSTGPPPN